MSNNKTALVTGANKGIGHEIARRLAEQGYTVWLGCRAKARGEAAAAKLRGEGYSVQALEIDVTEDRSVAAASASLAAQTEHLDVLVNNAGIIGGFPDVAIEESIDKIKEVYEVNVFGPIRVTQSFLPLLRKAEAARVVMMSSELGSISAALDPANKFYANNFLGYNSSKTALNAVTVSMAKTCEPWGIKVNAVDPGYTATDMNGGTGYRTVQQAAEVAVKLAQADVDGPTAGFFNHNGVLAW